MKRRCLSLLFLAMGSHVFALSKLDAPSRMIADTYLSQRSNPGERVVVSGNFFDNTSPNSRGEIITSAFIKLSSGVNILDITNFGIDIDANSGEILLVSGTMNDLLLLAETDLITLMSFGEKNESYLNKARAISTVDDVHSGTALPRLYNGSDVICGIYDMGLDVNHINFFNSDLSASRIKALYYFSGTTGTSIEYSTPERIASFTTDKKSQTHGTLTLGCMVGAFNGSQNSSLGISGKYAYLSTEDAKVSTFSSTQPCPYYGMAPKADIVAACGELYDANITGAVSRIAEYVRSAAKPAVINLSLGSILGPRDGTDARSQFISAYTSDAIIVVSSGNDANGNNSLSKTFSSDDTQIRTFLGAGDAVKGTVEIWSADASKFKITPLIYNIVTGDIVYRYDIEDVTDESVLITTQNYTISTYIHDEVMDEAFSDAYFQIITSANVSTNNRYSCRMNYEFNYNLTSNADGHLVAGFIVEGIPGQHVDIANSSNSANLSSRGIDAWEDGGGNMTINGLACTKNVIAVGAYTTANRWPTLSTNSVYAYNDTYQLHQICPFSSYGVTVDGRSLPHVAAPGARILSSTSKYYYDYMGLGLKDVVAQYSWNKRYHHWSGSQGTSLSSPIVAGIIALWLQADPTLTSANVIDIINKTSKRPIESLSDNNLAWGSGAIDALAGLKYILDMNSIADITIDEQAPIISELSHGYEIYVSGGRTVSATIYNLSGKVVKSVKTSANNLIIDTTSLASGIYVLSLDGTTFSQRIAVR